MVKIIGYQTQMLLPLYKLSWVGDLEPNFIYRQSVNGILSALVG
jgi:hypothetical protein